MMGTLLRDGNWPAMQNLSCRGKHASASENGRNGRNTTLRGLVDEIETVSVNVTVRETWIQTWTEIVWDRIYKWEAGTAEEGRNWGTVQTCYTKGWTS